MIEKWMQTKQQQEAPVEVSRAFFSSGDWWWWDTTQNVYETAINSGYVYNNEVFHSFVEPYGPVYLLWYFGFLFKTRAIAIAVSAIVILVTSRSLSMTFFSSISVFYILVSVTSIMSAAGWTLGFL